MKPRASILVGVCFSALAWTSPVYSEVWDFNCTEAVALLKKGQDRVVKTHDQLQEAKFSLRHTHKPFDGCSGVRRGYHGGQIHCVKHQSSHSNVLRDVLVAQRSLESAVQEFEMQIQGLLRQCQVSKP